MSRRMSIAEVATNNTVRNLIQLAHNQVAGQGEGVLVRALGSVLALNRIRAEHISPILGLIDGFTALTVQYGDQASEARRKYTESVKDTEDGDDCGCDDDDQAPPANKVPSFNHKGWKCAMEQARAMVADAYVLLTSDPIPVSPTTPIPSVEGAMGRRVDRRDDRGDTGGSRYPGSRH